jgi:hypothetical protein
MVTIMVVVIITITVIIITIVVVVVVVVVIIIIGTCIIGKGAAATFPAWSKTTKQVFGEARATLLSSAVLVQTNASPGATTTTAAAAAAAVPLFYYLAGRLGIFSRKSCSMTDSRWATFRCAWDSSALRLSAVKK